MTNPVAGLVPERSAEDIFAGRVRLTFAGTTYELPTLVIEKEEAWLASIDSQFGGLLNGLSQAGNNTGAMVALLSGSQDKLLDLLYSYDETHVLPARPALRKVARSHELIKAVMEVWVAANPLVGIALQGLQTLGSSPTNGASPDATSSPPPATAGRRRRSAAS